MTMTKEEKQAYIARRVAQELNDGELVNLGIGLPTLVAEYLPEDVQIILHSENGFTGLGGAVEGKNRYDRMHTVNSGGQPVHLEPGAAFFDSSVSFGLIRGGHVDVTVLGALQVDEKGNVANHMIPGKMVPGMGGAMDLLVGAKKVIIAMEHLARGNHKIMADCSLPLTGAGVVNLIVTEMGVFEVGEQGLVVKEINPMFTAEEVQAATNAKLIF